MRKKIDLLIRFFVLALLPAFILRPVVVSLHNGSYSGSLHESKFFPTNNQDLTTPQTALRSIDREAPEIVALVPAVSREKAPSIPKGIFCLAPAEELSSHKISPILRI